MSVSELFKDTRLPVLAAPLFIISYPELVIAQCKAGVIGSFPALNARPAEELEKWIIKISSELEITLIQQPFFGQLDKILPLDIKPDECFLL